MNLVSEVSLLEYLAARAGCDYISDLRYLQPEQRRRLSAALEEISTANFAPAHWKDALHYFIGMSPGGECGPGLEEADHCTGMSRGDRVIEIE